LLLGNEALAQGALDAGLSQVYAYPGTPSTEVTEFLLGSREVRQGVVGCRWTANEKTALEAAYGASYAGCRSMATMKHVGLNVAADAFVNVTIAGTQAGLLVVVADDPSMHSSQNEQDSRLYTELALAPCVEPSDQQEAYDAPRTAFELSEAHHVPVLLRMTTRLAHSRADVRSRDPLPRVPTAAASDRGRFILLPVNARERYRHLVDRQRELLDASVRSPFNRLEDGPQEELGIIACGIGYNYVQEVFGGACPHPLLKLSQYPIPEPLVSELLARCPRVLIVEEGYPFVETRLRGTPSRSDIRVLGRLSGALPRIGELTPRSVRQALLEEERPERSASELVLPRPPSLCQGCPHADSFRALNEAMAGYKAGRRFSDIGCYTLGALPPYEAIDTCIDMGASITMAKGAADAGIRPAVAVIGDSTFIHSGMTGLLDCVDAGAPVTVLLLDNGTIAMTGGQPSHGAGRLESICHGLGVSAEQIWVITPRPQEHERNVRILADALAYSGPSVVIARRECIQTARRRPSEGTPLPKEAS
jgi:indolepyruvate ferredoxin oxidoreductase alpha subunit